MDYFSKSPEAYPLPDQEATTVAEVLVREFICRFGVPLYIHSDQGRNFESAVFAEVCKLLGINKTRTTPLHPQSDGMVEWFNRTLEAQLSKLVDDHQRNWDQLVHLMLMAYRTAIHETTGCTPARLMLARDLRLPIDLLYGHPEEEPVEPGARYALELQKKMEAVHHFARGRLQLMGDQMKQHYDAHQHGERLKECTPVWLYNPQRKKGITPKLMRHWQGPFVVTKCINDLVYHIQLRPKAKPKVVHRNRLWKYSGTNVPTWFSQKAAPSAPSGDLGQECPQNQDQDQPSNPVGQTQVQQSADPRCVNSPPPTTCITMGTDAKAPRRSGRL